MMTFVARSRLELPSAFGGYESDANEKVFLQNPCLVRISAIAHVP